MLTLNKTWMHDLADLSKSAVEVLWGTYNVFGFRNKFPRMNWMKMKIDLNDQMDVYQAHVSF